MHLVRSQVLRRTAGPVPSSCQLVAWPRSLVPVLHRDAAFLQVRCDFGMVWYAPRTSTTHRGCWPSLRQPTKRLRGLHYRECAGVHVHDSQQRHASRPSALHDEGEREAGLQGRYLRDSLHSRFAYGVDASQTQTFYAVLDGACDNGDEDNGFYGFVV